MRDAVAFANQWIDARNSHDIDRIAAHYDSDVVFTSPVVTRLGFCADATIHGSTVLQAYFIRALALVHDLPFRPRHLLVGAAGVTSLGLSIVRTIAAAHDGRVWAHPRDGGGLTVTLELPVAPLSGEAAGSRREPDCGVTYGACATHSRRRAS